MRDHTQDTREITIHVRRGLIVVTVRAPYMRDRILSSAAFHSWHPVLIFLARAMGEWHNVEYVIRVVGV